MNINMGGFSQFINGFSRDYSVKVWLGDAIIENKVASLNEFLAENQFRSIVMELAKRKEPMKVKFSYDYFLKNGDAQENYIEFTNTVWDNAYKKD